MAKIPKVDTDPVLVRFVFGPCKRRIPCESFEIQENGFVGARARRRLPCNAAVDVKTPTIMTHTRRKQGGLEKFMITEEFKREGR